MIEVKAGYKQTEVGVIPEDWDVISYGEAFDFLSTASYSRADLSDNDEVFYVHYGDIHTTWNHFLDFKKYTLPTIEKIKVKNYSFIKDGDLIMADASEDYGGIGKSIEVKNITTNKAISGLHTFLLRGKEGIFVDGFKGYIHSNRVVKTSMERLATGLKVYGVSKTNLKTIQIPRPTLPEQSTIATILSDTDALIEHLEKLIAKKIAIKQGTMQQLLTGKKRLLGFEIKKGYKQTELGVIPEDWDVKEINIDIDLLTGYPFPSNQYSSNGIKLLRGSNIKRGVTDWSEEITQYWEKITPELRFYILSVGDIVIAMDGSLVGRSFARLSRKDLPALLLQRVARIRSSKIDMGFLKEFICSEYFSKYCDSVKTSSAIPHISPIDIRNFKIPLPPTKTEQTAIATILSDMDTEIEALEQTRNKYTMIKQGMMQQLLTGRIRIHGTN